MNKTEETKNYLPPQLTVVEFKSERGYALSNATLDAELHLFEWGSSDPKVSRYNEDNSWTSYSWN